MSNLPQATQIVNFGEIEVIFTNAAYLNATAIAKHFGKRVQHYLDSERTQDYIVALSEAVKTASQNLVIIKKGNSKNFEQGTWLHPKLAIDFARWLNPKFAVWCDEQIGKLLNLGDNARPTKTTPFDRTSLRQAVSMLVGKKGLAYDDAYKLVHQYMGVTHIDQIAPEDLPRAVAYVHQLLFSANLSNETLIRLSEQFFKTSQVIQEIKQDYLPFLANVNKNKGDKLNTCLTLLHYDLQDNCQDVFKLLPSDIKDNKNHPITKNLEMAYYADDIRCLM